MKGVYRLVISTLMGIMGMVGAWGQDEVPRDLSILNNTPHVANLINSSVAQGVSSASGLPSYSIPIYTVSSGSISVPISLSYYYPGFKPQQDAGLVGLGWNLNAGGVIAKTMFNTRGMKYEDGTIPSPLILDTNLSSLFKYHACSYSFPGHSGQFIYHLDESDSFKDQFYIVPNLDRLKIERGYKITDDNGSCFYFNDYETLNPQSLNDLNTNIINFTSGPIDFNDNEVTACNLSKIVSADKKDTIFFYYRDVSYKQNHTDTFNARLTNNIIGKALYRIESRNIKVQFVLGGSDSVYLNYTRKDINGYYPWVKGIQVTDKLSGELIKNIGFEYGYFGTGTSSDKLWLKLNKYLEKDQKDTVIGAYNFSYQTGIFPSKLTASTDFFGYYSNNILLNTTNVVGPAIPLIGNKPEFLLSRIGALTNIEVPTGGNIEYTYEPNDFNDGYTRYNKSHFFVSCKPPFDSAVTYGSTRFELPFNNGIYSELIHVQYGRKTAWPPNTHPIVSIFKINNDSTSTEIYSSQLLPNAPSTGSLASSENVVLVAGNKYEIRFAAEHGADSVYINFDYYDSLKPIKKIELPGIRLKSTSLIDLLSSNVITKKFSYITSDSLSTGTIIPSLKKVDANYNSFKNSEYTYKQVNVTDKAYLKCIDVYTLNSLLNGICKQSFYYHRITEKEGTGKDTLMTEYQYDLQPRVHMANDVEMVKKIIYKDTGMGYVPVEVDSMVSSFFMDSGYLNYWKMLTESYKTVYDFKGNNIISSSKYQYHSKNKYLIRSYSKNSDGSGIVSKYKYPEDYAGYVLGGAFKNNFVLSPTIEKQQWKIRASGDSVLLGGGITLYDTLLFKPIKQFSLETDVPLNSLSNETKDATGHYSSLISDGHYVDKGDLIYQPITGNLVRFNKAVGQYQYLIWGYNSRIPIAQIITANADTAQAYTSFEIGSDGGWNIPTSNRDLSTAVTGDRSFVLSGNNITRSGLNGNLTYTVSYWHNSTSPISVTGSTGFKQGMTVLGWTYFEHTIVTGNNTVVVNGTGKIDELRLYPKGAMMTTGTYRLSVGISSKCDANNRITYFEYDDTGRLKTIRNQQKEVIKTSDYQYINK